MKFLAVLALAATALAVPTYGDNSYNDKPTYGDDSGNPGYGDSGDSWGNGGDNGGQGDNWGGDGNNGNGGHGDGHGNGNGNGNGNGSGSGNYKACPKGLYSVPQCCATDVLGVADLNCHSPGSVPTSADNFKATCASKGQQAKCCVIPILGQDVLCTDPVGV